MRLNLRDRLHLLVNIELSKLATLCYFGFRLAGLHGQVWVIERRFFFWVKTDADFKQLKITPFI